jgi:hypothetical protein
VRLIKPLYGLNPSDLGNHVQYDTESIQAYIDRVFGRELNDLILDGVTRSMVTSSPAEASVVGFLAGAITELATRSEAFATGGVPTTSAPTKPGSRSSTTPSSVTSN